MKPIPQSYPMIITSKHKETEYLLSTNNHHHHHQHNNQSPINKQNIYYSNFCSSDDERENEQIQNKNSINGSIMNGTKYSNHPHQHPYQQHQHQPYQHRDPSLNSSYSIDKQSFIQKPIMSLNENELPNTASSTTFCIKLNPEEHSSSTYAQVY